MYDRFSAKAKDLMNRARQESVRFGHAYLGPEHIFLAMLGMPDITGCAILSDLGVDPVALRAEVESRVIGRPIRPTGVGPGPFTESAKKVVELALSESESMQHTVVGTGHILVALVDLPGSVSQKVLADRSITADLVRARVVEHGGLDAPGDDVPSESARRSQVAHQTLFVVVTTLENALRRVRDAIRRPF